MRISSFPSLPAFFTEPLSLLQMDGRVRYSPEFGESDMTVDLNALFSPVTAPRHRVYGLDLNNDYTDSSGMRWGSSSRGVT
jgi:hypothetical protein